MLFLKNREDQIYVFFFLPTDVTEIASLAGISRFYSESCSEEARHYNKANGPLSILHLSLPYYIKRIPTGGVKILAKMRDGRAKRGERARVSRVKARGDEREREREREKGRPPEYRIHHAYSYVRNACR